MKVHVAHPYANKKHGMHVNLVREMNERRAGEQHTEAARERNSRGETTKRGPWWAARARGASRRGLA